jgi:hypothetical protein
MVHLVGEEAIYSKIAIYPKECHVNGGPGCELLESKEETN